MDAVLREADAYGVLVVTALVALTTLVLSRVLVHLGRIVAGGRSPLPPQRDRTARIDSPAAPPYRSPTLSTSTEEIAARPCQAPPAWSVCLAFMLAVGALHLVARTSLATLRATGRCDDLTLAPWSAWDDGDVARAALAMSVLWLRSEARTCVERGERARSIDSLDDAGAERAFRTLIPTRGCTAAAEGALRAGRLRVARTIARSCHTDPATQIAWAASYALTEWPYHPDDAPLAARRLRLGESAGLEHVVFGDRRDFGSRDDLRDLVGRDFCFEMVVVPTAACDQSSGRLRCERVECCDILYGEYGGPGGPPDPRCYAPSARMRDEERRADPLVAAVRASLDGEAATAIDAAPTWFARYPELAQSAVRLYGAGSLALSASEGLQQASLDFDGATFLPTPRELGSTRAGWTARWDATGHPAVWTGPRRARTLSRLLRFAVRLDGRDPFGTSPRGDFGAWRWTRAAGDALDALLTMERESGPDGSETVPRRDSEEVRRVAGPAMRALFDARTTPSPEMRVAALIEAEDWPAAAVLARGALPFAQRGDMRGVLRALGAPSLVAVRAFADLAPLLSARRDEAIPWLRASMGYGDVSTSPAVDRARLSAALRRVEAAWGSVISQSEGPPHPSRFLGGVSPAWPQATIWSAIEALRESAMRRGAR